MENILLQDKQPFDLCHAQLRMESNNIMAEVRRKYELRPRLNTINLRRLKKRGS